MIKYVATTKCPQCKRKIKFHITEPDVTVRFELFSLHKEKECPNCGHIFIPTTDAEVEVSRTIYTKGIEDIPTEELLRELLKRMTQ